MSYGSDFSGVEDIDFGLSVVEGREAYIQAIARRYISPRGGHRYARGYGLDLRNYLADHIPLGVAQSAIAAEARKDERTRSATAVVVDDATTGTRTASVHVVPRDETDPFTLTLTLGADAVLSAVLVESDAA